MILKNTLALIKFRYVTEKQKQKINKTEKKTAELMGMDLKID